MKLKMFGAVAALSLLTGVAAAAVEAKECCKDGKMECCKEGKMDCCKEHAAHGAKKDAPAESHEGHDGHKADPANPKG